MSKDKIGLVLEGGAMRGMFTAGILDVFMEQDLVFDGCIGVSAGAVFGCNYKSRQRGRAIRYISKYCNDDRFCGFKCWWKTGDIYGAEFGYRDIPYKLDIFDIDTFAKNPLEFYIVATDVETGKPIYKKCETAGVNEIDWIRASASMPLVSQVVELGDYKMLDGGISDSIPLKKFQELGYKKNVVVLTQPEGFVKPKNPLLWLMRIALRKYPNVVKAMADRHNRYNETLRYIAEQEKAGEILVIRPPRAIPVKSVERDKAKLEEAYNMGREVALKELDRVRNYLK